MINHVRHEPIRTRMRKARIFACRVGVRDIQWRWMSLLHLVRDDSGTSSSHPFTPPHLTPPFRSSRIFKANVRVRSTDRHATAMSIQPRWFTMSVTSWSATSNGEMPVSLFVADTQRLKQDPCTSVLCLMTWDERSSQHMTTRRHKTWQLSGRWRRQWQKQYRNMKWHGASIHPAFSEHVTFLDSSYAKLWVKLSVRKIDAVHSLNIHISDT